MDQKLILECIAAVVLFVSKWLFLIGNLRHGWLTALFGIVALILLAQISGSMPVALLYNYGMLLIVIYGLVSTYYGAVGNSVVVRLVLVLVGAAVCIGKYYTMTDIQLKNLAELLMTLVGFAGTLCMAFGYIRSGRLFYCVTHIIGTIFFLLVPAYVLSLFQLLSCILAVVGLQIEHRDYMFKRYR